VENKRKGAQVRVLKLCVFIVSSVRASSSSSGQNYHLVSEPRAIEVGVSIIVKLRHERWRKVCCPVSCVIGGKEVMAKVRRPLPREVHRPCPSRRQGASSAATWRRVTGELRHRWRTWRRATGEVRHRRRTCGIECAMAARSR
jgi:hypothetical protein